MKSYLICSIVMLAFTLEACCAVDNQVAERETRPKVTDSEAVRESVKSFLNSWLIERNLEKALASFGSSAFANQGMLQEPCASYIAPEERGSEAARRTGIRKFLVDFLPSTSAKGLTDILDREGIRSLVEQLGGRVVNDPNVDLFALATITPDEISVTQAGNEEYLKKNLPASFFVSFVPIGDGLVYFFWIVEPPGWRIYHASLVCM